MIKENKEWSNPQVAPPKLSFDINYKTKKDKGYTNRVLLLNPPTDRTQFVGSDNYFPLGLLMLATILEKDNDIVEITDLNNVFFTRELSKDLFTEHMEQVVLPYIKEFKPDMIGLGGTFSGAFKYTKIISALVKNKFPEIPTVVGGNHASTFKGMIIERFRSIDYVVVGEAEHTFPELLKSVVHNNGEGLGKIDGLSYRKGGHLGSPYDPSLEKVHTPRKDIVVQNKYYYITNLDDVPVADFDIVGVDKYYMDTKEWYNPHNIEVGQPFPIISSRSCPMRCTFCNMWHVHGPEIRYRSADNVVDEIEYLYNKYDARYFQFMDDNFTFDKKRVIRIMNEINRRNLKISYDTPNGIAISKLDADVIKAMVEGGLIRISLAIESGSEEIRNIMMKGLKQRKIYEIAKEFEKYPHVFVKAFFIVGMPEETHETLEATRNMIENLPLDKFSINYATPFPGTALFNQCKSKDLLRYDVVDYVEIDNHQLRSDRPHFKPFELTEKDLMEFVAWGDEYLSTLSDKTGKKDPRGAGDINTSKQNVLISDF
tara:strand:- start:720 stop:2342 length:1623 start_codon:yes stop_codon:yes gene_type:complete